MNTDSVSDFVWDEAVERALSLAEARPDFDAHSDDALQAALEWMPVGSRHHALALAAQIGSGDIPLGLPQALVVMQKESLHA